MKERQSIKSYLEDLDSYYNDTMMYTKAEYQFHFITPIIEEIIENCSEISYEDKMFV